MKDSINIALCGANECTGCFACEGVCPKSAISQIVDEEGFRHPIIDGKICVGCHACEKVCPVLTPVTKYKKGVVYASWSLDDSVRSNSSSGGMFTEFAKQVLMKKGAVVGASMNETGYVSHIIVKDGEALKKLRGSKYVQSLLGGKLYKEIKQLLREGRDVLFTGCPCQVAAMRSFFKDDKHLFTIDLVCHGVPSPEVFANLYEKIKVEIPNLVTYNFRDYKNWQVCTSVNVNVNVNGHIINQKIYGEWTYYQDAFLKGLMHRPNCYNCRYTTVERVGDISLADFWGIGTYKPIRNDFIGGCSMVSVNSEKGSSLFTQIKDNIYSEERDIHEAIDGGNEQIVRPSQKPLGRDTFYQDNQTLSVKELIKKYNLVIPQAPGSLLTRVIRKIKRMLS